MGVLLNDLHRIGVRTRQFLAQFAGTRPSCWRSPVPPCAAWSPAYSAAALAQALLAGIGFAIAGTGSAVFYGFADLLPVLRALRSGVRVGTARPAAGGAGSTGMAIFLAVWGATVVGTIDNILKPLLIGRGLAAAAAGVLGVLGGALSFGLIGVFVGPVLLAVGQNLARLWFVEGVARRPEGLIPAGSKDGSQPKTRRMPPQAFRRETRGKRDARADRPVRGGEGRPAGPLPVQPLGSESRSRRAR